MLKLSNGWAAVLNAEPETGMGYQVASVRLRDGSSYSNVVIRGGYVASVAGSSEIPFNADDIASIEVVQR